MNFRVHLHLLCWIFEQNLLVLEDKLLHCAENKTPCAYPQNRTDPFVNGLHLQLGVKVLLFMNSFKTKPIPIHKWRILQNQAYRFVTGLCMCLSGLEVCASHDW